MAGSGAIPVIYGSSAGVQVSTGLPVDHTGDWFTAPDASLRHLNTDILPDFVEEFDWDGGSATCSVFVNVVQQLTASRGVHLVVVDLVSDDLGDNYCSKGSEVRMAVVMRECSTDSSESTWGFPGGRRSIDEGDTFQAASLHFESAVGLPLSEAAIQHMRSNAWVLKRCGQNQEDCVHVVLWAPSASILLDFPVTYSTGRYVNLEWVPIVGKKSYLRGMAEQFMQVHAGETLLLKMVANARTPGRHRLQSPASGESSSDGGDGDSGADGSDDGSGGSNGGYEPDGGSASSNDVSGGSDDGSDDNPFTDITSIEERDAVSLAVSEAEREKEIERLVAADAAVREGVDNFNANGGFDRQLRGGGVQRTVPALAALNGWLNSGADLGGARRAHPGGTMVVSRNGVQLESRARTLALDTAWEAAEVAGENAAAVAARAAEQACLSASLAASSVAIYSRHLPVSTEELEVDPPLALVVDDQLQTLMAPLARLQVRQYPISLTPAVHGRQQPRLRSQRGPINCSVRWECLHPSDLIVGGDTWVIKGALRHLGFGWCPRGKHWHQPYYLALVQQVADLQVGTVCITFDKDVQRLVDAGNDS